MVTINVEGTSRSDKGYVIAAITKALKSIGCDVAVQGETTHNSEKLSKTEEEIANKLKNQRVRIMEMQNGI